MIQYPEKLMKVKHQAEEHGLVGFMNAQLEFDEYLYEELVRLQAKAWPKKIRFLRNPILIKPKHGPQTWPWWKVFTLGFNRIDQVLPNTGWRMWIYTRWGAKGFDVCFDRRIEQ